MPAVLVPPMWSWFPAALPRDVLIARLSRKPRPTIRHNRQPPPPVALPFRHRLRRPSCRAPTNTSATPLVLTDSPIQAP
jgi:hypothetical protein